ncbi:MAG: flagellar basal-body rod protein FlgB [bacterium]|nr:MAG: flagellar basal-body rod protein FlgB [bacterium]KAF0147576.1 MAG: flagellar basal-body rod protein FlgB [bacterium]KAF0169393.1 MAG: flagellar basal-body rod protein FlgB [bacterium]TXT17969.1 MAG: flagellar basal-body rod protein FlgB [bacterium]
MLSKIDKEMAFVQNALNLRARRQEILASNIANSDTPNYKARDMDFRAALASALGAGGGSMTLAKTSARHLDAGAAGGQAGGAHIKFRAALQPSLDGNTVDPNVERAQFTENALHYQFLIDRATSTFRTLGRALESGR